MLRWRGTDKEPHNTKTDKRTPPPHWREKGTGTEKKTGGKNKDRRQRPSHPGEALVTSGRGFQRTTTVGGAGGRGNRRKPVVRGWGGRKGGRS